MVTRGHFSTVLGSVADGLVSSGNTLFFRFEEYIVLSMQVLPLSSFMGYLQMGSKLGLFVAVPRAFCLSFFPHSQGARAQPPIPIQVFVPKYKYSNFQI
jgi:hypothetical protein